MTAPADLRDARQWRSFFRSTYWEWRGHALLRGMDGSTFNRYSDESRVVQEALASFSASPHLPKRFLEDVSAPLLRLIVHMYLIGDDITAFLLAKELGDLQEDRGLVEHAARSLQFAGRCARVMRFYAEGLFLLERARRCALRVQADHPLLIEIYNLTGLVCHFTGRLDEAEANYTRSLEILERWPAAVVRHHTWRTKTRLVGMRMSNLLDLHLVRARRLAGAGKEEEIARARSLQARIREGAKSEPDVVGINDANEAEILMVEGRLDEARTLLHAAIRRHGPDSPSASTALPPMNRLLAQVAADLGEAREAYAHCREGLGLSLRFANTMEEGLIVEATLDIMSRFLRPRIAGSGLEALGAGDRQVIQNLVLLLESKDWYTGNNHSRAVSKMCRQLARRLLSEARTRDGRTALAADRVDEETLAMAGLLHDIGKLRIPWSLLNKRNPLVPYEHRILQSHVDEGVAMLRSLGFEELARLVEEHHEKLDGSGYPMGRRQISLMGSVIAVSDVYEAMITPNRRYATPKTRKDAVSEIADLAGVHYDSRVVTALRSLAGG